MEENDSRLLKDLNVPYDEELHSSIVPHVIVADNFELKSSLMQILQ